MKISTILFSLMLTVAGCADGDSAAETPLLPPRPGCAIGKGDHHDQPLVVDGDTRHYFLHVPASYESGRSTALLVDFHGTFVGAEKDLPEEGWVLPGAVAASEAHQFILVRPRSRYADLDDHGQLYQWDVNRGDLTRNAAFTHALVEHLKKCYTIDPARIYAFGFSSGTNMAAQFFADSPPVFAGYAQVGGGVWSTVMPTPFSSTNMPRIYNATAFRDYMVQSMPAMLTMLQHTMGFSPDRLWWRRGNTGHELYDWHYDELFPWLDRGAKPADGTLASGWSVDGARPFVDSLLKLARNRAGDLIAATASGDLWKRRSRDGSWTRVAVGSRTDGHADVLTDVCFFPSGAGVAIGGGTLLLTRDSGDTWTRGPKVPQFGGSANDFGYSYLTGAGCGGPSQVTGGGYWTAATSRDGGATWSEASMKAYGTLSQVAAVQAGPGGTWMAAGYYNYVGRSRDGKTFTQVKLPTEIQWYNGIAAAPGGRFFIVGEAGTVIASTDDGKTFAAQRSPVQSDLYAVSFASATVGMAVGAHGAAILTMDGGATWRDVSTGLASYLGSVVWLDDTTVLVGGEGGTVLRYTLRPDRP